MKPPSRLWVPIGIGCFYILFVSTFLGLLVFLLLQNDHQWNDKPKCESLGSCGEMVVAGDCISKPAALSECVLWSKRGTSQNFRPTEAPSPNLPTGSANIWVPAIPANLQSSSGAESGLFWQEKVTFIFLFIELSHLLATLTFFLMKLCVSLPPEANMKK